MSYWSDEAVQKRAAEAEQMRLAWKFRGITTSQLEMRLENNGMPEISRKDIEHELIRRGATYIKRSYYDRPAKFFGSDGSELIIAAAGEGVGKPIYDWDRMVAAENAYIDEVLAKPIPKVSSADMGTFLKNQTATIVRRVVPGLISMDSISGVQPMAKHIDVLPFFKAIQSNAFSDYALTKESIDTIIAADKDLQPVTRQFWTDRIDPQSIGRGLRPTVKYGDLHISDYMGLIHSNEAPKTSIGISALMESLKESGSTSVASFFDTESTIATSTIGGDFFDRVDTSKWIATCKDAMDKYVEDALKRPWCQDIMDNSVSLMYPNTLTDIDLSLGNKCMEVPITPIMKGTEITSSFSEVWRLQMEAMKKSVREMYYSNPFKVITAEAPRYKEGRITAGVTEGIEPVRDVDAGFYYCPYIPEQLSSKELRGGFKRDEMIVLSASTPKEKSVLTVDIPKKRELTGSVKHIKFDLTTNSIFACDEGTVKKTKEEDVAETLKLLGIGAEE